MNKNVKTRQQIADEYGIDRKTLYRWFREKEIQLRGKRPLSLSEQELVYSVFGTPEQYRRRSFER